jgi:serine O-acetyltransferase
MSLKAAIFQDFQQRGSSPKIKVLSVQAVSVALFRLAQAAGARSAVAGSIIKNFNHFLTGADIAWQCSVGAGLRLFHPTGVVVGAGVVIGSDCWIQSSTTIGGRGTASDGNPVFGDNVLVSTGARILGPIRIGDNVRIGANAVVIKDVPPGATAVGVPARHIMPNSSGSTGISQL